MNEEKQELIEVFQESLLNGTFEDLIELLENTEGKEKVFKVVIPFLQIEDILLICSKFYLEKKDLDLKKNGLNVLYEVVRYMSSEQIKCFLKSSNLKFPEEFVLFSILDKEKIWKNIEVFQDEDGEALIYCFKVLENTRHIIEALDFVIIQIENKKEILKSFLLSLKDEEKSNLLDKFLLYFEKLLKENPNERFAKIIKENLEKEISNENNFEIYSQLVIFYDKILRIYSKYLQTNTLTQEFKEILETKNTQSILSIPIEKVSKFNFKLANGASKTS